MQEIAEATHTASSRSLRPEACHKSIHSNYASKAKGSSAREVMTTGRSRGTHYSSPATRKPCEKHQSVQMANVMPGSLMNGPLRSRPLALSTMQAPVVVQPLASGVAGMIAGASMTGFGAGDSVVVKMSSP